MSEVAPIAALPLFAPPVEAEKGRKAVADVSSLTERREYLEAIRSQMRMLYRSRVGVHGADRARVTPDDARRAFEAMRPPKGLSRNFLAAVWREKGWTVVGDYVSETNGSHGNKLQAYAWIGG